MLSVAWLTAYTLVHSTRIHTVVLCRRRTSRGAGTSCSQTCQVSWRLSGSPRRRRRRRRQSRSGPTPPSTVSPSSVCVGFFLCLCYILRTPDEKTFSLYAYGPLFSLNIVLHTSVADLKCLNEFGSGFRIPIFIFIRIQIRLRISIWQNSDGTVWFTLKCPTMFFGESGSVKMIIIRIRHTVENWINLFLLFSNCFPFYPEILQYFHNDPAAPQDHCRRCQIRTGDLSPRSPVCCKWATSYHNSWRNIANKFASI